MSLQEIEAFINEMSAVKKMMHYLPIDILEQHMIEMAQEKKEIRSLLIPRELKSDLIAKIEQFESDFVREIHNR